MRICFMSQEDLVKPQGGTGTYVRNICITLASRGHDIHAIVRQRDGAPAFERVDGVAVHRVPAPGPPVLYSPLYFRRAYQKFAQLSRQARFDAVQGNLPLMSSWSLRSSDLPPVVETVHCTVAEELRALARTSMRRLNFNEMLTRLLSPVLRHRERELLGRARRVIAVSDGLKRELVAGNGYPADQVAVIPNGIDYPRFAGASAQDHSAVRRALGIAPDDRVILYLGRLMERKRVIDLVHALPLIRRRVPNARLVVVGKRNPNALRIEQAARELGLEQYVTLVDHVPYRDVPSYYAMADVYALPSAYEGFPFTVLEAMASGTPVVASRIAGIDEQIVDEQTGLLHQVGSVDAIGLQIARVLEDAGLAGRLAAAARRVVEQNYDWSTIGARTEQVFESVIAP
jgi:glycosyltransferase involved in cell wall biosynthesis